MFQYFWRMAFPSFSRVLPPRHHALPPLLLVCRQLRPFSPSLFTLPSHLSSSFFLRRPSSPSLFFHNLHHLHSSTASCGLTVQFPHSLSPPPCLPSFFSSISFSSSLSSPPCDGKHHHLTRLLFQPRTIFGSVRVKVRRGVVSRVTGVVGRVTRIRCHEYCPAIRGGYRGGVFLVY